MGRPLGPPRHSQDLKPPPVCGLRPEVTVLWDHCPVPPRRSGHPSGSGPPLWLPVPGLCGGLQWPPPSFAKVPGSAARPLLTSRHHSLCRSEAAGWVAPSRPAPHVARPRAVAAPSLECQLPSGTNVPVSDQGPGLSPGHDHTSVHTHTRAETGQPPRGSAPHRPGRTC